MFSRQFVNLVMKDFGVGGSYWLSRMMADETLFYPSVAEAIAARVQTKKETCMPYKTTQDLPSPWVRFKSSSTSCLTLDFMPFYGRGGDEGKIVSVDFAGQTVMYDADDESIEMLPRLTSSCNWRSPISLCVTTANANGAHRDSLYAVNRSRSSDFQALVYGNPYGFKWSNINKAWHWLSLPTPPYLNHPAPNHTIQSYTLLDDDKTICFSSVPDKGGFGTYCFDTSSHEWAKAGGWVLPFRGRAVQVPGLHGLWFGIGKNQHELRAVDLSSIGSTAPKVLHRWRCSDPPNHWLLIGSTMVYLGANRFCIARKFGVYLEPRKHFEQLCETAAILTGVEIVNGEGNKSKLQMVEHKSKTYIFRRCGIQSVL